MASRAKPETAEQTCTVEVAAPFQVSHDGQVCAPGERLDVPAELAETWARNGWAVLIE